MDITHYFDQTFEHWKYGTTTDSWGNTTEDWTKNGEIKGRLRPLSGDRIVRDAAQNVVADAKFYLEYDEFVLVGDRLRIDKTEEFFIQPEMVVIMGQNRPTYDFEITAVINPMSMDRFLQVEARLI